MSKPERYADVLRRAIRDSGLTHYRIGKDAGVSPTILDRFMAGTRGLNLETASKIGMAIGLELAPKAKGK